MAETGPAVLNLTAPSAVVVPRRQKECSCISNVSNNHRGEDNYNDRGNHRVRSGLSIRQLNSWGLGIVRQEASVMLKSEERDPTSLDLSLVLNMQREYRIVEVAHQLITLISYLFLLSSAMDRRSIIEAGSF